MRSHSLSSFIAIHTDTRLLSAKTAGELIRHFIVGGDDTNMMASEDKHGVKVIGCAGRNNNDMCVSSGQCSG
jgi:hypothetical protein